MGKTNLNDNDKKTIIPVEMELCQLNVNRNVNDESGQRKMSTRQKKRSDY